CAVWSWRRRSRSGKLDRNHSPSVRLCPRRGETMLPTAEESQAQLRRRIAAQDREALAEFYDQTAGALFSIALRIIGDSQEAEEIIQDRFVQTWDKDAHF